MKRYQLHFFMLLFIALLLSSARLFGSAQELDKINQAIREKGASWTAGETWVSRLSPAEREQLLGTFIELEEPDNSRLIQLPKATNLPSHFDWRDNNGNWVTPAKYQGQCGSCWAFGSVAHFEAWYKIQSGDPNLEIDLSEQYLVSPCCTAGDCDGGSPHRSYEYLRTHGIPNESCFPYQADDSIPCESACADVENQLQTIPGWGYITLQEASVEAIKTALMYQPVGAHFNTYEDFSYYRGGVYEPVWGELRGYHIIIIVGWDDAEQCWICKNSWGEDYGDNGFFKMRWGVCDIGINTRFIWADTTGTEAVQVAPENLNFSIEYGDSICTTITIQNNGHEPLEYSAIDNEIPVLFHPSQFNSYDESSWWCGDPEIGGYGQRWLQYLDTPVLDLSQTQAPELNFMACWAVQSRDSVTGGWDGNDGCNIWISTDGGQTYSVILPISPEYNCQSLYGFGKYGEGWNMGPGIAGWGDFSDGWMPARFDLQAYRAEQVVIRFAFASDYEIHTRDNQELTGFFVDEITVTDGVSTLFSDHGNDGQTMQPIGSGSTIADWLKVSNPHGEIAPDDSANLTITVGNETVAPRLYAGNVQVRNNAKNKNIPITLEVKPAISEIALGNIVFEKNCHYNQLIPQFRVYNYGQTPIENIQVNLLITDFDGNVVLDKNEDILSLPSGYSYAIDSSMVRDLILNQPYTGTVELQFNGADKIAKNNQRNFTYVPKLQETFADSVVAFANWNFIGGWGIFELSDNSSMYDWYSGGSVAASSLPEAENLSNTRYLSLKHPINLEKYNSAKIIFYLLSESLDQYAPRPDFDLQIQLPGSGWQDLEYHAVGPYNYEAIFTPYIESGIPEVWIRFQVKINDAIEGERYYVDNIRLVTAEKTGIEKSTQSVKNFQLSQNYPNPFNSSTRISLTLPEPGRVNLNIYNTRGELVRRLLRNEQRSGAFTANWDGCDDHGRLMPTGVYFIRLNVDNQQNVITKKMILLK